MIELTETSGAIFGKTALSIFESLILTLLEENILDEETVKEILEDASATHRNSGNSGAMSSEEIVVAAAIDGFSRTILTIHQNRRRDRTSNHACFKDNPQS